MRSEFFEGMPQLEHDWFDWADLMPLTKEHLAYFKDLIEGRAAIGWIRWWQEHEVEFNDLPRMDFLELKFKKLEFASKALEREGIPFQWSARGRQEAIFADYHPNVCGEDGRPSLSFFRSQFKGGIGALEDGGTATIQLTIHSDHLFYDSAVSSDPVLRFAEIALADADGDDAVTQAELAAFSLNTLATHGVGSLDIDNMWDYIHHMTTTLGHIDGEGHCDMQ